MEAAIVLAYAVLFRNDVLPLLRRVTVPIRTAISLFSWSLVFIVGMAAYFTLMHKAGVPFLSYTALYKRWGWPVWSMFMMISIMPAVVEELAFRGVVQSRLIHVVGQRQAWLIQAAMFSVLHMVPLMFPSHFAMGLGLGYLRSRSKSLYPGMMLHATWNGLIVLMELSDLHFLG